MKLLHTIRMGLVKHAANSGEALAATAVGADYAKQGNHTEAVRWFRKAAEVGFPDAQVFLGYAYDDGKGVEQDRVEAVRWYRRAAEQGDTTAQIILGTNYLDGAGVEKDIPAGLEWYRKAADKGDISARVLLGTIYANSEYVPKDNAQAVIWYSSAFQATSLTPALAEKYKQELCWFLGVAEIGDGDVLLNVANLYHSTNGGIPQDDAEAMRWYRLAAEKGNEEALCFIGRISEEDGNFSAAMRWYQQAAEKGNAGAVFNIAMMYNRGEGVSIDASELYFWFSLCSSCLLPEVQAKYVRTVLKTLHPKLLPESVTAIQERARCWIEGHPKLHGPRLYS